MFRNKLFDYLYLVYFPQKCKASCAGFKHMKMYLVYKALDVVPGLCRYCAWYLKPKIEQALGNLPQSFGPHCYTYSCTYNLSHWLASSRSRNFVLDTPTWSDRQEELGQYLLIAVYIANAILPPPVEGAYQKHVCQRKQASTSTVRDQASLVSRMDYTVIGAWEAC